MAGQSLPPPITTLGVGDVEFDDSGTSFIKNPSQGGIIADCMIHNHYERDRHVYQAGLTSPEPFNGALVGMVRLANDTLLWVCEWTVCQANRTQHPPVVDPSPPPGWELMDVQVTPAMISVGPSGIDEVFRISGVYVYGCLAPQQGLLSDVVYPYPPWVQRGLPRLVPTSALDYYLKHPQPGVGTGGTNPGTTGGGGSPGNLPGTVQGQGLTPPGNFVPRG